MRTPYRMRYYDRCRPCWLCSRSLAIVSTGRNRGRFAAASVVLDKYERDVHVQCLDMHEVGLRSGDEVDGEEMRP